MDKVQTFINQASILIAGSSDKESEALSEVLKVKGYKVMLVSADDTALQISKENPPDLIILKAGIPDCDSLKIIRSIKYEKGFEDIPIILIYSSFNIVNKELVYAFEGVDFIAGPFNKNEVLAKVGLLLRIHFLQLSFGEAESKKAELLQYNSDLENKVAVLTRQLDEITTELKEFNVLLEEEITERIKTEDDLRESERQFRHSIEKSPVPMMLFTEDGEIIKISRTWSDLTGYTEEDLKTTFEWAKIIRLFNEDTHVQSLNSLKNSRKEHNDGEYAVITRDGETRTWDFYSAYVGKLQDGRSLFSRAAIDITIRKQMEGLQKSVEEERRRLVELKEYDRIKTEFFANISHEFRTPINVIFSALQMHEFRLKACDHTANYPDCHKHLNTIRQNCFRLLRLINNLIDITKIDSGYFDLIESNYDIVSIVENVTLSVADYVENKGLSLIFDTNIEEKVIACDPEKIERIILNLLSNAVKFTPKGGNISVNIEDGTEYVCIKVKDTGRGIPHEKLDSIFERFVQVDKSLTRDHEGSGIGLSLVKALIELHGGKITVSSKEGQGTEFVLYFPCKLADETVELAKHDITNKTSIDKINIELSDIYN